MKICADKDCANEFIQYRSFDKYCSAKCKDKNAKQKSGIKKHINKFSAKLINELAIYRPLRDNYMDEHVLCEVKDCNREAEDLHHKNGRGKNLYNVEFFMAVCRMHHAYIHEHPSKSREDGYLI